MTLAKMDPTYTGKNRSSLDTIGDDNKNPVITFSGKTPALRLGGRAARFTSQAGFTDIHHIGYSRFDDKGSVLMANIDAVLNLTGHIGGCIADATEDNNTSFYSLLLEDHTLEMHSYVQWRRPLSVSRVVISRVLTKASLKTAQLDLLLKTDVPAIIGLKPCDGYRIIGLISHGSDTLTGALSVTLKDLVTFALTSLAVIHRTLGKGFVVFPFRVANRISGTMTNESILDYVVLCVLLYKKVWLFRPYMCHEFLCVAFAEPRDDPPKDSVDEQKLLALWDALRILPIMEKHTSPSTVDPEIAKLAEIDMTEHEEQDKAAVELIATRNFTRLFDGSEIDKIYPKLASRVDSILREVERPEMIRDRVEVLSRWQIPDSIDTTDYPF
jgi:hypothetical protein